MIKLDELFELTEKYKLSNPNEENPMNFFNCLGADALKKVLKKALQNDLKLHYIDSGVDVDDGGKVILIKK